jgi:glucose/arabinose dehydrogenase
LRRVAVTRDTRTSSGWRVTAETPMFAGRLGRVRAVASDREGRLYFTTSNRDGRGSPSRYDDKVLRLARRR